jgi:type I restriction enzyme S subunit
MIGTIGNPIIVESDDFAIKNVALIKEKTELLNDFLIYVLDTDLIRKQFYRLNAGGTQKFIALGLIKQLLVPVPSIKEQKEISEFLSLVEMNLNNCKKQLLEINTFKKGLLQQMFI